MTKTILIALGAVLVLAIVFWIWHKRFHAMVFFKSLDALKQEVTFIFQGKDYTLAKGEGIMANGYNITANFVNMTSPTEYYVDVFIDKKGKRINTQRYPNNK